MKRCLLAATVLVAVNCGLASADYVIVKINLNQILHPPVKASTATTGPGGVGTPAYPGIPGPGMPGYVPPPIIGNPNIRPGGIKGVGVGKKGIGAIPQPYPIQPPIQPKQLPVQPVQPGVQPVAPQPDPASLLPPVYVYAYLEVKAEPKPNKTLGVPEFDYKLGEQTMKLWLADKNASGTQIAFYIPKSSTVAKEFAKRFDKLQVELKVGVDDGKKQKLVFLAEWALQRGLLKEFNSCIDELKKHDAKHAVVIAVEKTRGQLKEKPKADDPTILTIIKDLQGEGYRSLISDEGHYTLLTNIKSDAGLKKKLAELERVHAAFFYWFAIKGEPRTPPDKRLAVVLIDTPLNNPTDFVAKHKAFDYPPLVGSGFTAQRDNVIFMASRRMDDAYEMLAAYNQQKWDVHKTNMNDFLSNVLNVAKQWPLAKKEDLQDLQIAQTLTLCQKAMEEENDVVTLSHEGIRQLIAATGLLPRNMQTAEWARFGLASFFETPPEGFYPSTGGPNWTHLINFKILRRDKKIDVKDAKEILLRVITDDYLRQAYGTWHDAMVNKEDRAALKDQAQHELDFARAVSWSLMYYLVRNKDKELQRYFDEINNLPRDTDFDGRVLRDCFCRAFGLLSPDPANPGRQMINPGKFEALAKSWFAALDSVRLDDIAGYEEIALKLKGPQTPSSSSSTTTQPGGVKGAPQPGTGTSPQPGTGGFPAPGGVQPGSGGTLPGVQPGQGGVPGPGGFPAPGVPPGPTGKR